MELLALNPLKLPPTETLEFKANSAIADGQIVVQYLCGKDRLIIDLSLSARLGKGLLGNAEVKATSEWKKHDDSPSDWRPKDFVMESQLWGMQKKTSFAIDPGQLDPLSVAYALRGSPMHHQGESRHFKTRDQVRGKTIELFALEKKRESTSLFGSTDLLKLEFREIIDGSNKRPDFWYFWVEATSNVLARIDIGHEKLGNLTFNLIARRD